MTKVEIDIEIPDGFEFVRYGVPTMGDWVDIYPDELPVQTSTDRRCNYLIYRKAETWRKATPQEIFEKMIDDKKHRMRVPKSTDFVLVTAITSMDCNAARVLTADRLATYYAFSEIQILDEPK